MTSDEKAPKPQEPPSPAFQGRPEAFLALRRFYEHLPKVWDAHRKEAIRRGASPGEIAAADQQVGQWIQDMAPVVARYRETEGGNDADRQ